MTRAVLGFVVMVALAGSGCSAVDPVLGGILEYQIWRAGSGDYVSARGVRMYVEHHGPPSDRDARPLTPVLVLHGGFGATDVMAFQTRALAKTRRVIAVDTRGHGRSSDDGAAFHYTDFADDFLTLIGVLGEERVDVVGWSDGGITALLMAEKAPERVRRVVAIGANATPDGVTDEARALFEKATPDSPDVQEIRMLYGAFSDGSRFPSVFTRLKTLYLTEPQITDAMLARIYTPTLVLVGEKDMIRPEHSRHIAGTIPRGRLEVIAGGSHAAPIESPREVNAAVLRFLDGPAALTFPR